MHKQGTLREFGHYAAMNILGMIGISCYILADTYFVAQGLGSLGLAALNIAIPAYNLMNGIGLMIGVGVQGMTHKELCGKLRDAGLLALTAGKDTLRLLPPLVITKEEIDKGLAIMAQVMK